jgi:hypothetical protein
VSSWLGARPADDRSRLAALTPRQSGVLVTLAYTAITVVMTWPLSRDISRWIAADMGDPVFNAWVLMWTGGQILATLGGDFNAIHSYFDGNIFHPQRLTLAYSEHLTPQSLQALPLWAATDNIVFSYNVVFLSTFVLSGLGMYLFVRELTGRRAPAFVAGLAFAFAPYRLSQFSHLQVLSAYWMPFVLLGLRRYFVTRRTRPLVGAAAALVLQNLSCGYYMLFFSPFVGLYALYEMAHRGLLKDLRVWRGLAIAAVAAVVCTWPFVAPYLEVRRGGDIGVRTFEEIEMFSADTHAFATASTASRLWGERINAFPKGEGEGFPGFTIAILAAIAAGWVIVRGRRAAAWRADSAWQRNVAIAVLAILAADIVLLLTLFIRGTLPFAVPGLRFRHSDALLIGLAVLPTLGILLVPAWRRALRGMHAAAGAGFFIDATILAALLALGPRIHAGGQLLGAGPYYWLWSLVPGFDGVRAPARFFMIVALFLAILAGIGVLALVSRWPRFKAAVIAAATIGILAESWVAPMATNVRQPTRLYEFAPRELGVGQRVSPIYQFVKQAPGKVVLIEFPFAEPAYDVIATFYAGYHRRPLVNGYSGFFPEAYVRKSAFLTHIPTDLDAATKALSTTGATHALVHEGAFPGGRGHEISDWLTSLGATVILTHGTDKLLKLK